MMSSCSDPRLEVFSGAGVVITGGTGFIGSALARRLLEKGVENLKAIIDASVIDKHDFVPTRDPKLLKRANEFRDTFRAVKDRNHDREGETRCSLGARLVGLNHRRRLPWQRLRELTRRTETSIPLERG
jgi:hypothetical protein